VTESSRLQTVLERTRERVSPNLSSEFVADVSDVEERNQFDDDRGAARTELRRLIAIELEKRKTGDES
jgi:hypothetical protein